MAKVVIGDGVQLPPPGKMHDKASRNKRKYRADPPVSEGFSSYDLFAADRLGLEKGVHDNLDTSSCIVCNAFAGGCGNVGPGLEEGDNEWQRCWHEVDWSCEAQSQLEEILLNNLDIYFTNMVKVMEMHGYARDVARKALLDTVDQYGWRETLAIIVDSALTLMKGQQEADLSPREDPAEDLRKLEKRVLNEMLKMVNEAQPFVGMGDTMWWLLICDMNMAHACAPGCDPCSTVTNTEVAGQHAVNKSDSNSNSNLLPPPTDVEFLKGLREKLSTMLPPQNAQKSDSSVVLGIPNLPSGKHSTTCTVECMVSSFKAKDLPAALSDRHADLFGSVTTTQTMKLDKLITSKKVVLSSTKRENSLRQKSSNHDKSLRAFGAKSSGRSCKHSAFSNLTLERKCKSVPDSTLKASSKLISANVSSSEVTVDVSFTAGCGSSSSVTTKHSVSSLQTPVAGTELLLSPPIMSNGFSTNETQNPIRNNVFSFDKISSNWVPQDKKDEIVIKLVPRLNELQMQMQDWKDWAQQKVMQAARRLGKDKEELQLLRLEKDEVGRFHEERRNLEENTRKKLGEMESAISKASTQVEKANLSACRLEGQNARLRHETEAAKLRAAEFAANCEELTNKEATTLRKIQLWESQKVLLQEELSAMINRLSQLQQQLESAKEHRDQTQARWQHEECLKNEALARVSSLRKEREQMEASARLQENALVLNAENELQRYKNDIRGLESQILKLKLSVDPQNNSAPRWAVDKRNAASNGLLKGNNRQVLANLVLPDSLDSDEIQRDRECVMCLSEERTVVFLPCAHQVVCVKCNGLHETQGMRDCPSCRTPIQRRIRVRPARSGC